MQGESSIRYNDFTVNDDKIREQLYNALILGNILEIQSLYKEYRLNMSKIKFSVSIPSYLLITMIKEIFLG